MLGFTVRLKAIAVSGIVLAMLSGGNAWAQKVKITLSGSSTVAPLASEIAARYEQQNPTYQIDVQSGGSSRGMQDARRKLVDIGMVSRALKAEEADLQYLTIANDGLVMIVHASNGVAKLSDQQISQIYTRRIQRWDELGGGLSGPITLVNKAEGRSTLEIFLDYTKLKPADIKPDVVIGENEEAIRIVSSTPSAIGYVSFGTAEYHVKNGTPIRILPLGAVEASEATIANGQYAARRPLNLVSLPGRTSDVERFWQFAASKEVEDIVRDNFFTPPAH